MLVDCVDCCFVLVIEVVGFGLGLKLAAAFVLVGERERGGKEMTTSCLANRSIKKIHRSRILHKVISERAMAVYVNCYNCWYYHY